MRQGLATLGALTVIRYDADLLGFYQKAERIVDEIFGPENHWTNEMINDYLFERPSK